MLLYWLRCFALGLAGLAAIPAPAAERLSGPYSAAVERVVDGDTLAVRVRVWLGHELAVLVRVRGIDCAAAARASEARPGRRRALSNASLPAARSRSARSRATSISAG
jgi:endonuclease YncB( thermonuclease family)